MSQQSHISYDTYYSAPLILSVHNPFSSSKHMCFCVITLCSSPVSRVIGKLSKFDQETQRQKPNDHHLMRSVEYRPLASGLHPSFMGMFEIRQEELEPPGVETDLFIETIELINKRRQSDVISHENDPYDIIKRNGVSLIDYGNASSSPRPSQLFHYAHTVSFSFRVFFYIST